jgi:LAO/AO transport system kinase
VKTPDTDRLLDGILSGDRVALARAITLIESTRQEDRTAAAHLLTLCLPYSGNSIRVAVTGAPGVGKSSFIEALGTRLVRDKRMVAVLVIDPSSSISRGSILGDKTRMQGLAAEANAFIRPSPTAGTTGGTARRTREAIVLVEAAGFDTVFVETVGVGQSETTVHTMVDFFLLLAMAGAGDELQGIKRGIIELADAIAITKADGDGKSPAQRARVQFRNALALFPPSQSGCKPSVHTCSAVTGEGLDRVWETVLAYIRVTKESGFFELRRREQARHWLHQILDQRLQEEFFAADDVRERVAMLEDDVVAGRKSAAEAAEIILATWRGR